MKTYCFGINGMHAMVDSSFTKACNYINKNGKSPNRFDIISKWNLIYNKSEISDNNWLYIGEATEDMKKETLHQLQEYRQIIMII